MPREIKPHDTVDTINAFMISDHALIAHPVITLPKPPARPFGHDLIEHIDDGLVFFFLVLNWAIPVGAVHPDNLTCLAYTHVLLHSITIPHSWFIDDFTIKGKTREIRREVKFCLANNASKSTLKSAAENEL